MKRLTVVLVLCAAAVWNIPAQQGDFEIEDDVLVKYRGNAAEVRVPNSVTAIGDGAFSDSDIIRSVSLPSSLTSIGEKSFAGCSGLGSVTLPAGLTSIGEGVFFACENLTAILVDKANRIYTVRDGVLFNKALTGLIVYPAGKTASSYAVPDGVTHIGIGAFSGCGRLISINLPVSLTAIGDRAFFYCSSLDSINLPADLTTIGYSAFGGCFNLASITLLSSKPPSFNGALSYGPPPVIYVPAAALNVYRNAEGWKKHANRIQAIKE